MNSFLTFQLVKSARECDESQNMGGMVQLGLREREGGWGRIEEGEGM